MSDERGVPLTAEHMGHAADLASRMVGSVLISTTATIDAATAAAMAVELAMGIMNETRQYELRDGRIERKGSRNA